MIPRTVLLLACSMSLAALAQRPDCPRLDAPLPMSPPGPPPTFLPPSNLPANFNDPVPPVQSRELTAADLGAEEMQRAQQDIARRRAANWIIDVEEGHVTALVDMSKRAKAAAVPPQRAGGPVDVARTPLASWRYLGYMDFPPASRAHRFFRSPDGSLLSLEEWAYKADGGAVFTLPGMNNRQVGAYPATINGMRGPSGCVVSSLSWQDARKHYELEVVGPLDVEAQRALLMQVAESIAAQ